MKKSRFSEERIIAVLKEHREPALKWFRTLLVSNVDQPFGPLEAPHTDWLNKLPRIVQITMAQDQALRERILIYMYKAATRNAALWGLNIHMGGRLAACPPVTRGICGGAGHAHAAQCLHEGRTATHDESGLRLRRRTHPPLFRVLRRS